MSSQSDMPEQQIGCTRNVFLQPASQISTEERACLDRLLESNTLSRAPRLQAVLRYLIECYVDGRLAELNEQTIGHEVFGRPKGYNPGDDNIVRATVRHLRNRLEEYYAAEGKNEPWILEIPKGKYIPFVHARADAVQHAPADSTVLTLLKSQETPSYGSRNVLPWSLAVAALLLNVALAILLLVSRSRSETLEDGLLQQLFFTHNERVSVVVADANLQAYRTIFNQTVSLNSFINRSFIRPDATDPILKGVWRFISARNETTVTSAILAARIQRVASPDVPIIRHPADLNVADFQNDNFILLGGPWINPWAQMFEDRLNFRVVPLGTDLAGSQILNVNPGDSEPKLYVPHTDGPYEVAYVRIAILPNLRNTGRVVLFGSNLPNSLEAAGDYLTRRDSLKEILRTFVVSSVPKLPALELVLEVSGLQNTPRTSRIIAHRIIASGK
jgi:hypothetical protein